MTPIDVINRLARDPAWTVRIGITKNPSAPNRTLEMLAQDSSDSVRTAAQQVLNLRATATEPSPPETSVNVGPVDKGMRAQPTEAGWYHHPDGVPFHQAYWDGEKWTGQTRPTSDTTEQTESTAVPSQTVWTLRGVGAAVGALATYAAASTYDANSPWAIVAATAAGVVVILLFGVGVKNGVAEESKKAWRMSIAITAGFVAGVFVGSFASDPEGELSEQGAYLAVFLGAPILIFGGLCLTAIGLGIGDIYRRVRPRLSKDTHP